MTKFIIDFIDTASENDILEYLSAQQCSVVTIFSNLFKVYLVEATTTPQPSNIVTSIINDSSTVLSLLTAVDVVTVPCETTSIDVNNEKEWWKVYTCGSINLSETAVDINIHKTDNIVYLVDSGIDSSHPEFIGRRIENLFSLVPGDFTDLNGHGTALASLLTGNTCSINDSIVKIVKIYETIGEIKTSVLLSAFDAIITDFLANPNVFTVVNLSWAIARNSYIEQKIQILNDLGLVVVVASGNSGLPIQDVTPAAMKDVVTVGSYNSNFEPSNFSNYGATVTQLTAGETNYGELDGWAPGEKIWVATPGGGYGYSAGTSSAAAIHSCVCLYNAASSLQDFNLGKILRVTNIGLDSAFTAFLRTGLLNLSDPKYNNSPNRISTFVNGVPTVARRQLEYPDKIVVRVNSTGHIHFFMPNTCVKYEQLTQLPSWCTIEGNFIVASPTVEPLSASGVDTYDLHFTITPTFGEPYDKLITIVVLSSTFNADVLLPDDPLIAVVLLINNCEGFYGGCDVKYCKLNVNCEFTNVKTNLTCFCSY